MFVAVFVTMCVWAVRNVVTFDAIERPYEIDDRARRGVGHRARTPRSPTSACTTAGSATSSSSTAACAATLKIDDERRIPEGRSPGIFRKSAIGEPYIDFQPPPDFDYEDADEDDFYQAGDDVPIEDTTQPPRVLRAAAHGQRR